MLDSLLLFAEGHLDRMETPGVAVLFLAAVEDDTKRRMLHLVQAIGEQISLADLDEETVISRFRSSKALLEK